MCDSNNLKLLSPSVKDAGVNINDITADEIECISLAEGERHTTEIKINEGEFPLDLSNLAPKSEWLKILVNKKHIATISLPADIQDTLLNKKISSKLARLKIQFKVPVAFNLDPKN